LERLDLLHVSTDIAYALLESGAEIYRVEESILRMFKAYGMDGGSVFAIPTFLLVSLPGDDGKPLTEMRRIGNHGSDLAKVGAYNDLCRRICKNAPDAESIRREMQTITAIPHHPFWLQVAAFGVVGLGFTLLFGGSGIDAAAALLCGMAIKLVLHQFDRFEANSFFTTICVSFVAGAAAFGLVQLGFGQNLDKIIIGVLMNLVPGVALTNFMRDIIAGDLIAGLTKLVEALLTATGIALGTGVALSLGRALMGVL